MDTTLFERILSVVSNFFAISASAIAVYLFLFKRDTISSAFRLLLNYSKQLTLSDLMGKLDRLNDFNATDDNQRVEVVNILHEVEGQILGNKSLKEEFPDFLKKLNGYTSGKKEISEPLKRSLVSELRENLRNLDVNNFKGINSK